MILCALKLRVLHYLYLVIATCGHRVNGSTIRWFGEWTLVASAQGEMTNHALALPNSNRNIAQVAEKAKCGR